MEKEKATTWVQARHKDDILHRWTWNECIFFLLLSPTTQMQLGGLSVGDTAGSLRLLVVERVTTLLALRGIGLGAMPYRVPRNLGCVYGEYETINRIKLAAFCNLLSHHLNLNEENDDDETHHDDDNASTGNREKSQITTTEAASINNAVERHTNILTGK